MKRTINVSLETAREWYSHGGTLKEVALQAFTDEELHNILTWDDIKHSRGFYFNSKGVVVEDTFSTNKRLQHDNYLLEAYAKSAMAMAKISHLLPHYNKNWKDGIPDWEAFSEKYCCQAYSGTLDATVSRHCHYLLAFETPEIRDSFLEHNTQLVRDYLMID